MIVKKGIALDDYSLGDLWQKNILGGRLSK